MEHYFITGVSSGIGYSLVKALLAASQELNIHGCARRNPLIQDRRFQFYETDLADVEKTYVLSNDFFKLKEERATKIVLINNAGSLGHITLVGQQRLAHYQHVMTVNSLSPMILSELFVKQFQQHTAEKIVFNISSGAAQKDIEGWAAYCASKAALERFTSVCAKEQQMQRFPIHFHTISPGVIDTPMQKEIRNAPIENFPSVDRFLDLYRAGELLPADEAAQRIKKLIEKAELRNEVSISLRNF